MREEMAGQQQQQQKRNRTLTAEIALGTLGACKETKKVYSTESKTSPSSPCNEMESLNKSLTSLQWLCDMRLLPCLPSRRSTSPPEGNDDSVRRPDLSYAELISLAIENSKKVGVSLNEIYTFILDAFSYYRTAEPSWKNSIRYNLSQNKLFCKIPTPGITKGVLWAMAKQQQATVGKEAALSRERSKKISAKKVTTHHHKKSILRKIKEEEEGDDEEDTESWQDTAESLKAILDDDSPCHISDPEDWLDDNAAQDHPWAEDPNTTAAHTRPVDVNVAASLASCLSIWPLSASALAAESLNGGLNLEFSINGSGVDLSRGLFDSVCALDDAPVPRDWM